MIAIIDYQMGNVQSIKNAFDTLKIETILTADPVLIEKAQGIILPGVGAAGEAMKRLQTNKLDILLKSQGKPLLGICLGMQLLLSRSEEGNVNCLNLIPGSVRRFKTSLKVPQIGWNTVTFNNATNQEESAAQRLFATIPNNSYFYFVHSFFCEPQDNSYAIGITTYDQNYCSVVCKDNVYGAQFHPEKSGTMGLTMLQNFAKIVYEQ